MEGAPTEVAPIEVSKSCERGIKGCKRRVEGCKLREGYELKDEDGFSVMKRAAS
ncbi:uncharacterized protein DS421_3g85030 [Arachis hypogaea]|nr:uncharacterized protein DS421_3g85030 [Arachis hypogaea]